MNFSNFTLHITRHIEHIYYLERSVYLENILGEVKTGIYRLGLLLGLGPGKAMTDVLQV